MAEINGGCRYRRYAVLQVNDLDEKLIEQPWLRNIVIASDYARNDSRGVGRMPTGALVIWFVRIIVPELTFRS